MKCCVALVLLPLVTLASEIRISSLNVNFGNTNIAGTLELIARFDPDVILLQESTTIFERKAKDVLPRPYAFSWFTADDEEAGGGFAVISKLPLVDKEYLKKSAGAFGAQKFGIKLAGSTIQFLNIHLNPAPLPKPFTRSSAMHLMMLNNKTQVLEIRKLLEHRKEGEFAVVAGDLNSFPNYSAYRRLTAGGFIDAHLSCNTNASVVPTWRMNVDGNRLQGRLDFVFHSPGMKAKTFSVVECPYSDHALLNCVLEIKE
jgi:endonuclease/exonuclease/phosphatase family metal-dependent hydrolase